MKRQITPVLSALACIFTGACSQKAPDSDLKNTLDVVFQQTTSIQSDVGKAKRPSYILFDLNRQKVVGVLNTAPVLHAGDFIAWDEDDLYEVVYIRVHTRKPKQEEASGKPPERSLESEAIEAGVKFVRKMTEAANTPPPQPK